MALIQMGAIATEIKGKLGGHVFQGSKGGTMIRTKGNKNKRNFQLTDNILGSGQNRNLALLKVAQKWTSMKQINKDSWNNLVGTWTFTNKFGEIVNRNGYAIFTAANINLLLSDQPMITVAPLKDVALDLNAVISFDFINLEFLLTMQNSAAQGQIFVLEQALPTSQNKTTPTSNYKIILVGLHMSTQAIVLNNFIRGIEGFVLEAAKFSLHFRIWTFKNNYPKKYGVQKIVLRLPD